MSKDQGDMQVMDLPEELRAVGRAATWQLICEHLPALQEIARRSDSAKHRRNDADARLHDLLLKLVESIENNPPQSKQHFLNRARKIANNKAIDQNRKCVSKRGDSTIPREVPLVLPSHDKPRCLTSRVELEHVDVDESIDALPEDLQGAAVGWLVLHRSPKELATAFGFSERNARDRCEEIAIRLKEREPTSEHQGNRPRALPDPAPEPPASDAVAYQELIRSADVVERALVELVPEVEPAPGVHLVSPISQGGNCEVWKVSVPALGKEMVAKIFPRTRKVTREQVLYSSGPCDHPNVVRGHFIQASDNRGLLLMEQGESLRARHSRLRAEGKGGVQRESLLECLEDIGDALDFLNCPSVVCERAVCHEIVKEDHSIFIAIPAKRAASERGIVHRDVNPDNIMFFGARGKLGNFSLAAFVEHDMQAVNSSGPWEFRPPEFYFGVMTRHSDQWASGATYYQMRCDRLPFTEEGQVLRRKPDLFGLPEAERSIVARALALNPRRRWKSCREFVERLRMATDCRRRVMSRETADGNYGEWKRRVSDALASASFGSSLILQSQTETGGQCANPYRNRFVAMRNLLLAQIDTQGRPEMDVKERDALAMQIRVLDALCHGEVSLSSPSVATTSYGNLVIVPSQSEFGLQLTIYQNYE